MTVEICMNDDVFFVPPLFMFPRKRMKDELMDLCVLVQMFGNMATHLGQIMISASAEFPFAASRGFLFTTVFIVTVGLNNEIKE